MIIALAQANPIVGDLAGNAQRIIEFLERARPQSPDLVVFPELSICGYPPKDLVLKPSFLRQNIETAEKLAQHTVDGPAVLVGCVRNNDAPVGKRVRNSLALLRGGRVEQFFDKSLLPTYDVFDEHRYFEPATRSGTFEISHGQRVLRAGITICEDLWNDKHVMGHQLYPRNPIDELKSAGCDIVINSSASPFVVDKQAFRERLMGAQAKAHGVPIIYVNQIGGNDELVFDGASCVFDTNGEVAARCKAFEEDLLIVELTIPSNSVAQPPSAVSASTQASLATVKPIGVAGSLKSQIRRGGPQVSSSTRREEYPGRLESVWAALVLGTRDYVRKCGFNEVVIGLSGGIDSALTACIAVEALGPAKVHGVAMPSRYSSDHSLADAKALAKNLGIGLMIIPIEPMHAAFEKNLTPHFDGRPPDTTEENIQARIRGNIMMSLSNKFGWLLLTTGNKSELAVGYCTLYGDMCGGLAVISDVPKTMIYELARWHNARRGHCGTDEAGSQGSGRRPCRPGNEKSTSNGASGTGITAGGASVSARGPIIPESSITKLPSAELRPDQHDQQSLPPYDILDAILLRYVEQEKSAEEIIAEGYDAAVVKDVIRKVDLNEYKRKQAATGLKVTSRAFGAGRRMPIAARVT